MIRFLNPFSLVHTTRCHSFVPCQVLGRLIHIRFCAPEAKQGQHHCEEDENSCHHRLHLYHEDLLNFLLTVSEIGTKTEHKSLSFLLPRTDLCTVFLDAERGYPLTTVIQHYQNSSGSLANTKKLQYRIPILSMYYVS